MKILILILDVFRDNITVFLISTFALIPEFRVYLPIPTWVGENCSR